MKFLVDECTGPKVAQWLIDQGHNVFSVYHQSPGASDQDILVRALKEERILITNDRDFGELIFRHHAGHCGVIFLRLSDETTRNKITVLEQFFLSYTANLEKSFIVLSEKAFRIARRELD